MQSTKLLFLVAAPGLNEDRRENEGGSVVSSKEGEGEMLNLESFFSAVILLLVREVEGPVGFFSGIDVIEFRKESLCLGRGSEVWEDAFWLASRRLISAETRGLVLGLSEVVGSTTVNSDRGSACCVLSRGRLLEAFRLLFEVRGLDSRLRTLGAACGSSSWGLWA